MSSFNGIRKASLIGLSAVSAIAMRHVPAEHHWAPRSIAVVLSFDAGYQAELGEAGCLAVCVSVLSALRDTMRHVLNDRVGYAAWDKGGAPRDTLELRWMSLQPPSSNYQTHLAFMMRGQAWRTRRDSIMVTFEDAVDLSDRRNATDAWSPSVVRSAWVPKVARWISDPRVHLEVFSRLPLDIALDDSLSRTGKVRVRITPAELGTFETAVAVPEFIIAVRVLEDPPSGLPDTGDLRLSGCVYHAAQRQYSCDAVRLVLTSRVKEGADLTAFRRAARVMPVSVHVARFQPTNDNMQMRDTPSFPP